MICHKWKIHTLHKLHSSISCSSVGCEFNVNESTICIIVVFQLLSHVWLFATSWTAAHQASLSFTLSQSLLKLMAIESVRPYNHFILCHLLLLLPSIFHSIRVFSNELALRNRWPQYWRFSFSICPSNEYSELISLRIDWFELLAIQRPFGPWEDS